MVARSKGLMLLPQKSYLQSLYESFSHSEGSGHQIVTLLLGNNPVTGSPGIQGRDKIRFPYRKDLSLNYLCCHVKIVKFS